MTKLIKSKKEYVAHAKELDVKINKEPEKYPVLVTDTMLDHYYGGPYRGFLLNYLPYNVLDIDAYVAGFIKGVEAMGG